MEITFENIIAWINAPIIHIGSTPLTVGGMGAACVVFIGGFFISGLVQKVLSARLEKNFKLSPGISYAVLRILHYAIVVLGFVVATQMIGLNFGSLAVVFGFLSVGIGFGLQNVTSNFIAGIILLIERPVSAGDFVKVDGQNGKVVKINMRSTIIMTLDNIAIIVPNSKFVENNVVNWSAEDAKVRLHCPVGVAYGSDIAKVKATLLRVAEAHPDVLKHPSPEVRFLEFGDSSLNFDLLAWTNEPMKQFKLHSEINYAIDESFRREGVQIPFPQRDLHLKMTPAIEKLMEVR